MLNELKIQADKPDHLDGSAFREAMLGAAKAYKDAGGGDHKVDLEEFRKAREKAIDGFKPVATPTTQNSKEAKR